MKLTGPKFEDNNIQYKRDKLSKYQFILSSLVSYELEYKMYDNARYNEPLDQLIKRKIIELNNLRMDIEIALSKLPIEYQTVLKLKYIDGKTFRQIGQTLHYCEHTISRYHNKGLQLIEL